LYLTTVIDLEDRKVIGMVLSETMNAVDKMIPAFNMAQKARPTTQKLISILTAAYSMPVISSAV